MIVEIITKEDLETFRLRLLYDLKQLLTEPRVVAPKEWLKTHEVRRLLQVSSGTLQTMRNNGTIKYTKIGSIIYYSYYDIQKMLNKKG